MYYSQLKTDQCIIDARGLQNKIAKNPKFSKCQKSLEPL